MINEYDIRGMTCAACQARVEKTVKSVPGVKECRVNFLTARMTVDGNVSPETIANAVKKAGYGAVLHTNGEEEWLLDRDTPRLSKRLFRSVFLLFLLMVLSFGHSMLKIPFPSFFTPLFAGIAEAVLALLILVINREFFIKGFGSLIKKAPNMDTLVALGSGCSFLYSLIVLCAEGSRGSGDLLGGLYFETAAMIPTLITVGKLLEAKSRGKTVSALRGLLNLRPRTAHRVRAGQEETVPVDMICTEDIFAVRPGEIIPTDGVIVEGYGDVDESAMTGESIPAEKKPGDEVIGGTVNGTAYLLCRAIRIGKDTTLSQIIHMVEETASTKAPIARIADRAAGIFVPTVIGIAALTGIIWGLAGKTVGFSLARAVSVLVISCPCSLGLATPVAVMVGSGVGARNGILFKTSAALEAAGKVGTVICDKTGTVTAGKPVVTDVCPDDGVSYEKLLSLAVSLEAQSEHPLGRAIVAYGRENGFEPQKITAFQSLTGRGVSGMWEGTELFGGSKTTIPCSAALAQKADALSEQGKTPMLFRCGNQTLGIIAVSDVIKPDAPAAVRSLKNSGIHTVLLTGDNERTALAVGTQAGFDEVIASALPHEKAAYVSEFASKGTVCMVGDGINDAPALSAATIGMAIGAGADVTIDAADIVLPSNRLSAVCYAIQLSRATLRIIRGNLFWAFFYNVLGIPLAAGVFYPAFGWLLNPMIGAASMSLSSICVVLNAYRLNRFTVPADDKYTAEIADETAAGNRAEGRCGRQDDRDFGGNGIPEFEEKIKKHELKTEETHMMTGEQKKVVTIEGMMCMHCEQHVVKALLSIPGVTAATADHQSGKADISVSRGVGNEAIIKCVEDAGYRVLRID